LQVIHHICECLSDLHSAGYVHRDLKPGNIMWLPSQNRWTLIDFGCAARIGEEAPVGFTLGYAAPEAVKAHFRESHLTIKATTALDTWSVGVLSIELFTGRPALMLLEGREKVRKANVVLTASDLRCRALKWQWHSALE
jgi:serine/threonine protein kinase